MDRKARAHFGVFKPGSESSKYIEEHAVMVVAEIGQVF
jgi:hypothetical protein